MSGAKQGERAGALRRHKPYPAYKDSGVEWLGEIPVGWEVKRLKHLATLNPESLMEHTDPTLEMVYVDIGGVDSLGRIVEREQLTFASAPSRARRLVRDGDVIVSTVRTYLRAIAPISDPEPGMVVSTGFAVVRPADDLTTDYAAYALRAPYFVERVVANSKGVSFPAINESEMATYELASPPEPEQRAIAAFLDRETARIDALVAKKERLIELLQEQRTALITRAVTKGLDPTVPMKESGVEWLGEVPAHWDTSFLDKLVDPLRRITYGIVQPGEPDPDGILMVRGQNYSRGWSRPEDIFRVAPAIEAPYRRARLKAGDIVMTIVGAGTGNIAIVPDWLEGANLTQTTARIALDPRKANNRYFAYQLQSVVGTVSVELTVKGAAQPGLNLGHISKYRVVVPSLAEQTLIADKLDRETSGFDVLSAKVSEAVERLKEFRTALISAAVTGKIDVREEVV